MGLPYPTQIQQQCIPAILAGRDVIASAPTGSGKTAAFAVPILQLLSQDPYGIFCLVLTPTRELALQIKDQFDALGAVMQLKVELVIGGEDILKQRLAISKKPHVIVSTPGRLKDHLNMNADLDLRKLRFLVLDEADRLLTVEGFKEPIEAIVQAITCKVKQTLLFSATMTVTQEEIRLLSLRDPLHCSIGPTFNTVETLKQEYLFIPAAVKDCYLTYLIRMNQPEEEVEQSNTDEESSNPSKMISIIVFTAHCRKAQILFEMLRELGIKAVSLHSAIPQYQRTRSLESFRSGYAKVLVATDVASRGLDIPTVELVVNYDIPLDIQDYIHRVGRTARADRFGRAITFVTQHDIENVHRLEATIGKQLEQCPIDESNVLQHLNETTVAKARASLKLDQSGFLELTKKRKENFGQNTPRKQNKT